MNGAQDTLARTIRAEDESGGPEGMAAVASVVMNRIRLRPSVWGYDVVTCCLKPWQFSTWNAPTTSHPNSLRAKALAWTHDDLVASGAWDIAGRAIAGQLEDPTGGCDSYVALWLYNNPPAPVNGKSEWFVGRTPDYRGKDQVYFRTVNAGSHFDASSIAKQFTPQQLPDAIEC